MAALADRPKRRDERAGPIVGGDHEEGRVSGGDPRPGGAGVGEDRPSGVSVRVTVRGCPLTRWFLVSSGRRGSSSSPECPVSDRTSRSSCAGSPLEYLPVWPAR